MDPVRRAPSPTASRLARALADGSAANAILPELERWLDESRRFRDFAATNSSKLRKKLRGAADDEALRDVRLELLVARLLLDDRVLTLTWEPAGSGTAGPDFTISIPGVRPVALEVTRLRRSPVDAEAGTPWIAKLRQLPPGAPAIVLVAIEGTSASALDVASGVRTVRARADARDDPFFASRGLAGGRAFYAGFLRLGAIATWCEDGVGEDRVAWWPNPSARIPVPERVTRACVAALRRDPG